MFKRFINKQKNEFMSHIRKDFIEMVENKNYISLNEYKNMDPKYSIYVEKFETKITNNIIHLLTD